MLRICHPTLDPPSPRKGPRYRIHSRAPKGFPEDRPILFDSDEGRLQQVILNLIDNAIKFTEEGRVTIRAMFNSDEQGIGSLKVSVEDTGIGIREEDYTKLFEPFTQLDDG